MKNFFLINVLLVGLAFGIGAIHRKMGLTEEEFLNIVGMVLGYLIFIKIISKIVYSNNIK